MFEKNLIILAIIIVALLSASNVPTLGAEKAVTAIGNAQIDTAQSKFGGASGLFDGTGDCLNLADSDDWYFGTGDFTIDFWIRLKALPSSDNFWAMAYCQYVDWSTTIYAGLARRPGPVYSWALTAYSGGNRLVSFGKQTTVSTNTWHHVAYVRSGNSWYVFQDGKQVGSTETNDSEIPNYQGGVYIGSFAVYYDLLNGWLDEYRISNGVARWTTSFTPPSTPYSADAYTALLLHCDGTDGSTTFTDTSTPSNPDFSLSSSKTTISMNLGSSDTSTITVRSIAGFSEAVTLTSSWTGTKPSGVTVSFSQNTVTPSGDGSAASTLTVTADTFSSTGTYTLTITGTAGTTTHSATISLTISAQAGTYSFNVRAGATKITLTCAWSTSGSMTVKLISPSATYTEADMLSMKRPPLPRVE